MFLLPNKSAGLDTPSYRLAAFRRGCDKLCRCARSQIHKSAIGLNSGDESKTVLERYQVIVIFNKKAENVELATVSLPVCCLQRVEFYLRKKLLTKSG